MTLATSAGFNFDTPATLAVRVLAAARSGSTDVTTGVFALAPTDEAPSFGSGSVPAKTYYTGTPIAEFQAPAARGGNGALSYAVSDLPARLVFDATSTGSCPGMEPREVCGTPTAATSGAQTVTVTAQDADANRAVGDQSTLTFQVTVFDNPTLAATPAPFPAPSPVVRFGASATTHPEHLRREPHDLIGTARRLTESGAAQPTQADLRRAVSTAYYALFHCLAAAAADLLTGSSSHSPEWHQVYRALEHGKARSACQQQGVMRTFPMEVRAFGDTFIDLQKARQQADYAHEGEYSKPEVLAIINAAEDAINKFEQADVRHRRSFAVHVLFKRRQP